MSTPAQPAGTPAAPVTYSAALHVDPRPTLHTCGTAWRAGVTSTGCYGCTGRPDRTVAR